jgi:hypothetical protein
MVFPFLFTACGGGGDPAGENLTEFVSWSGNLNGIYIADASNEFFKVRLSNRIVVAPNGADLTGLTVSNDGIFLLENSQIGVVQLVAGGGSQVAALRCKDGKSLDIVLNGNSYQVSGCTTENQSSTPVSNTGNTSINDFQNATDCLQISRNSYGTLHLTNRCQLKAYYSYCLTGTSFLTCGSAVSHPSGYSDYSRGTDSVLPGATDNVPETTDAGIQFFACSSPSGKTPYPVLTSFNPPRGVCI